MRRKRNSEGLGDQCQKLHVKECLMRKSFFGLTRHLKNVLNLEERFVKQEEKTSMNHKHNATLSFLQEYYTLFDQTCY